MNPARVVAGKNTKSVTEGKAILLQAALSGLILTLAYPRLDYWMLAWVGLIPLIHALERSKKWQEAFFVGLSGGVVFFVISISWLHHVTVFGWLFVAALQALYWGIFGILGYQSRQLIKCQELWIVILAACWVGLEFIRTEVPVWGFGWNLLGTSQASNLWMAQLASVGGVYLISFLIFLGNAVLYYFWKAPKKKNEFPFCIAFLIVIGLALLFGWNQIQRFNLRSLYRVSVLQGNIPQLLKWDSRYAEKIIRVYSNLTRIASYDEPRLIIWPEAAYPGFFNDEEAAAKVKSLIRDIQIPVLIGAPYRGDDGSSYNSAYLLDAAGTVVQRYDKIRLVPFGEYVPWKPVFGFLEPYAYALGVSDFSAGKEYTVFKLPPASSASPKRKRAEGLWPRFSVLICFEDTFPSLARSFVNRGADFLVVITNDAWFGDSSAPYQHLQASIFRAIENGVSVVRAANTGVSGFITPMGQVVARIKDKQGKDTFVMGGMTYPGIWAEKETLYQAGGWLFPYLCVGAILFVVFLSLLPHFSPREKEGGKRKGLSVILIIFSLATLAGCIRLTAGGFYAKKTQEGEPQVKEFYVDTDELIRKKAPGRIEVYE